MNHKKFDVGNLNYRMGLSHEVLLELEAAAEKFPQFNSAHEGYAVLAEEVDELWDEVKRNPGATVRGKREHRTTMRKEAIQIAAMALRFIEDVCDDEPVMP